MGMRQVMYSDGTPSREVEDDDGRPHALDLLVAQKKRIAELEAARDRNHVLHLSALDKIAQVLTGRDPEEIAWWLRANHADYLADRPEGVRSKITAMAEACETKCTN